VSEEREARATALANLVDILARAEDDQGTLLLVNDSIDNPVFAFGFGGFTATQAASSVLLACMALLSNLDEPEAFKVVGDALVRYMEATE
jgi:hypothetical protein